MNDIIIRAEDLCKVYRLYSKPHYRMLDMFGLLRKRPGRYTEHVAVDHLNLEIRRGEKVAFIGRNGAGKSTLLKLIAQAIEPTSGRLEVKSRVHALLQIGTGFHPEFTGRENVYSYLAQLGVTGSKADRMVEEIVEFTELEEYIDQPIKTYSTGMGMRLMFATSTAIEPDILVLDEVLGVGDAYFAQKSYEKIKSLCEGQGSTLLLVTHDVYSAMRLCERFVWLDRGQLLMEGSSRDVVHAYEKSIRAQEEHRLRMKRIDAKAERHQRRPWFGQLQLRGQQPPRGHLAVAGLRIMARDQGHAYAGLSLVSASDGQGLAIELSPGSGNWSDLVRFEARDARIFLAHGSIFHRLPFLLTAPGAIDAVKGGHADVELTFWCDGERDEPLEIGLFEDDGRGTYVASFVIPAAPGWQVVRQPLTPGNLATASAPEGVVRYGSRALEIVNILFMDGDDNESHLFTVGSRFRAVLAYRLNDPAFDERPTVIVAFHKDGVTRSHRFWTDLIRLSAADATEGKIEVEASPLLLGAGTYTVTISVFREGYFESNARHLFFSANAEVLDIHSRGYEIVVRQSSNVLCNDIVFQHPASWHLNDVLVEDRGVINE